MLIMVTVTEGSNTSDITRTDKPTITALTTQIMRDMILEECFEKPVEEIEQQFQEELAEQFDPIFCSNAAMWTDPTTEVTYTFILV